MTYNLHVLIRFELERALLGGDLAVADLPGAWAETYRHYLGVTPADDAEGCLQDIHWSAGLVGYFPTYTLGNLYAAQLFDRADADLGGLAAAVRPRRLLRPARLAPRPASTARASATAPPTSPAASPARPLDPGPMVRVAPRESMASFTAL